MKFLQWIYRIMPLAIFITIWELLSQSSAKTMFLFSAPSKIIALFFQKLFNSELLWHTWITAYEAFLGLLIGMLVGSSVGFLLLYFPKASRIFKYYIIALSAIPIFAIAPMMIIWFGTEVHMKIAMAFFATVFVAIFQAYQGGQNFSKSDADFFYLNDASNKQKFWKLTFPASIDWLIQSLKLNSGLSILGAFIGEFIASDKGLGYTIIKASGLYDVTYVLAATISIILLTLAFNYLATVVQKYKLQIIRSIVLGGRRKTAYNMRICASAAEC